MELKTAIQLIEGGIENLSPQLWIDLGSGDGLFSMALATLLGKDSSVVAIDKSESSLGRVPVETYPTIRTAKLDFVHNMIPVTEADGILMANSLHFVKDKVALLSRLRHSLKFSGRIIIVEYEMTIPNPWVPYPISYNKLASLNQKLGWAVPRLLKTMQSVFQNREIYSALIKLNG